MATKAGRKGVAPESVDFYGRVKNELPAVTASDNGKALKVSGGKWAASAINEVPIYSESDIGKRLALSYVEVEEEEVVMPVWEGPSKYMHYIHLGEEEESVQVAFSVISGTSSAIASYAGVVTLLTSAVGSSHEIMASGTNEGAALFTIMAQTNSLLCRYYVTEDEYCDVFTVPATITVNDYVMSI